MKHDYTPTAKAEATSTGSITLKVRDADLTIDAAPNGTTFVFISVPVVELEFPRAFHEGFNEEMQRHGFDEREAEEFMDDLFNSIRRASQLKVLKSMLVV